MAATAVEPPPSACPTTPSVMPLPAIEASHPVLLRGRRNQALKAVTITCCESIRQSPAYCRRNPVKLNDLTIAPKLGICVGLAMFGLCLAGALATYLIQREGLNGGMLSVAIPALAISSGCIAWMIGRGVGASVGQVAARMRALADGELETEIPGLGRGDEVGALAATVQMLKDNATRLRGIGKTDADAQGRALAER